MQFFWEKNSKSKGKGRFNLLLLEFGEYYFEDYSVYHYPIPSDDMRDPNYRPFLQCDAMKVQGRLKLCSRSIVFEPISVKKPLLKFPFKAIRGQIDQYRLRASDLIQCSLEASGFLSFSCISYFEMKANDKIGPYKLVEATPLLDSADIRYEKDSRQCRVLFAIVHSDLNHVISRIQLSKRSFDEAEQLNFSDDQHSPLIKAASISNFDTSQLVNYHEKLLLLQPMLVNKIKPLVMYPGCMMVTESRIYFQPAQLNNIGDYQSKDGVIEFSNITRMYKRRYLLQQIGLELFLQDQSSALFVFESPQKRDELYEVINNQSGGNDVNNISLEFITRKWQRREMSTYDYLMYLNTEADRSMNDLTQYPVFPHIIADYNSTTLDLENPSTFRDLSKPIGALNDSRLEYFKERFRNMSPEDEQLGIPPPFLYGTHYSTPGYVLFYLVRVAPEYMLCLQSGKFDSTDRMFSSIKEMWQSCLNNQADLKELIPEFYCGHGEFLINSEELNMGHKHTGERLGDVELPAWAKTPHEFIRKCVKALECEYVSNHIHEWIDLIFGYKQTGPEAIKADNLFYHLTYEGSVDFSKVRSPSQRKAIELQIQEFGQTPKQLFNGPHPCRNDVHAMVYAKDVLSSRHVLPSGTSQLKSSRNHRHSANSTPATSNAASSILNSNSLNQHNDGQVHDAKIFVLDDSFRAEVEREIDLERKENSTQIYYKQTLYTPNTPPPTPINHFVSFFSDNTAVKSVWGTLANSATYILNSTSPSASNKKKITDMTYSNSNSISETSTKPPLPTSASSSSMKPPTGTENFHNSSSPERYNQQQSQSLTEENLSTSKSALLVQNNSSSSRFSSPNNLPSTIPLTSPNTNIFEPITSGSLSNFAPITPIKSQPRRQIALDLSKLSVICYEPQKLHSDCITGLSFVIDTTSQVVRTSTPVSESTRTPTPPASISNPGSIQSSPSLSTQQTSANLLSGVLCSCSKDSAIKIIAIVIDVSILPSPYQFIVSDPQALKATVKRTYMTGTEPPLSSCLITKDGKTVFAGCWDNSIYSFSVPSACIINKRVAHKDSVSSISSDASNRYILSGSWDTTVKLWELKSTAGMLSAIPVAEFYDHEQSVVVVALEPNEGVYAAAGAEDGNVIIWDTKQFSVVATIEIARDSVVTCLVWIPSSSSLSSANKRATTGGYQEEKLVSASNDGTIVCTDCFGRLYSTSRAKSYLRCVTTTCLISTCEYDSSSCLDATLIIGGCDDGSIRIWSLRKSVLDEIHCIEKAHIKACTAITCVDRIIISGGDDGFVKIWKICV